MTENTPPDENVPASQTPDIMQALEELKAANAAIVQKLEAAEKKNSELEARVTALSAAKAGAPAPAEPEKSELDIAYEKALEELGIKKK
jgi:hypothetical protein